MHNPKGVRITVSIGFDQMYRTAYVIVNWIIRIDNTNKMMVRILAHPNTNPACFCMVVLRSFIRIHLEYSCDYPF